MGFQKINRERERDSQKFSQNNSRGQRDSSLDSTRENCWISVGNGHIQDYIHCPIFSIFFQKLHRILSYHISHRVGRGDVIFREGSRKKSNISIISNLHIWLTFHIKNRRIGKKFDSEDLKNRRIAGIGIQNRRNAKNCDLRII